jgi:single-strand DNA-binding protein
MAFEVEGILHKKFETEQKTESFKAREFVLLLPDERYPQYIKFQLTQDNCELLDKYDEKQKLKVYFDLRGREWNEKFFTNLQAWKIEGDRMEEELQQTSSDFDDPDLSDADVPQAEDFDEMPF